MPEIEKGSLWLPKDGRRRQVPVAVLETEAVFSGYRVVLYRKIDTAYARFVPVHYWHKRFKPAT